MQDKHIKNKKLFSNNIIVNKKKLFAIPTVLDRKLIKIKKNNTVPRLGQNNNLIKNL